MKPTEAELERMRQERDYMIRKACQEMRVREYNIETKRSNRFWGCALTVETALMVAAIISGFFILTLWR